MKPPQLSYPVTLRSGTTDSAVFSGLFMFKEIDVDWHIDRGQVIDLGANIGLTTAYFAQSSPETRVIAVEPDIDNFKMLRLNTERFPNVTAIHAAIWPEARELQVVDSGLGKWAMETREKEDGGLIVQAITIDDVLAQANSSQIDLLKIDIEGAEAALFSRGWESWLPKVRRILIELHDSRVPDCSRNFYRAITSRPFSQRVSGEKVLINFLDECPNLHLSRGT